MVAAFDYCLHGKGGAAPSIDTAMHGLVDARPHRPPAPGLRHRAGDRRRRGGADQGVLRRPGRVGRLAPPGLPAGPRHRRDRRRPTRRRSACVLGGHGITAWGDTSEECESNSLEIIRTAAAFIDEHGKAETVRCRRPRLRAAPRGRAPRQGGGAGPGDPRPRLDRQAAAGPLRRQRRGARVPRAREAPAAGRARHLLPRPLPAHQGASARRRPAGVGIRRGHRRAAAGAARVVPRGLRRPTTTGTRGRTARRCAAPTRRSCWCPVSACSASARTSRPRGSRASSTSTRST